MVAAVGVAGTGEKVLLGFVQTATENRKVCAAFLRGLVERGLRVDLGLLARPPDRALSHVPRVGRLSRTTARPRCRRVSNASTSSPSMTALLLRRFVSELRGIRGVEDAASRGGYSSSCAGYSWSPRRSVIGIRRSGGQRRRVLARKHRWRQVSARGDDRHGSTDPGDICSDRRAMICLSDAACHSGGRCKSLANKGCVLEPASGLEPPTC